MFDNNVNLQNCYESVQSEWLGKSELSDSDEQPIIVFTEFMCLID